MSTSLLGKSTAESSSGGFGKNLLNVFGQKISNQAQNLILQANDNLIEDLTREIGVQKRQYEENIKFRMTSERDLETLEKENEKLRIRLEHERQLLNSKKKDPKKQAKILSLRSETVTMKSSVESLSMSMSSRREEFHAIRSKLVIQERINDEFNDKIKKHQSDIEDKISLDQKIQMTKLSIEGLIGYQQKLNRMHEKYAKRENQKDIHRISEDQSIIVKTNIFERKRMQIEEEFKATGDNLYSVLDEARKLVSRNNLINDKLVYTMGILRDDYVEQLLTKYQSKDFQHTAEEENEFSKASVAYFFRQFMVEVMIGELIQEIEVITNDYDSHKAILEKNNQEFLSVPLSELSNDQIDKAMKINEVIQDKMTQFRALTKQQSEVVQLQRLGVERFQDKIRVKCIQQVKERQKIADIFYKDGNTRVLANTSQLRQLSSEVDRLLRFKWLIHKKDYFLDFRKKTMTLTNENSDLTANFMVLKLVLEKVKALQKNLDQTNIQKADKLIQILSKALNSLRKDHVTLIDIEERIKQLKLQYDVLMQDICKETDTIVKDTFGKKSEEANKLSNNDDELSKFLDSKKNQLFSVKGNIDNDDEETQRKFQIFELSLADATLDEDQANDQQRQIQSKQERIQRQYQKLAPITQKSLEDVNDILDSLATIDPHYITSQGIIDGAYEKVKNLDTQLQAIEAMIKDRRNKNCSDTITLAFSSLDRLNKILSKLNTNMTGIEGEQEALTKNGFEDQEKQRDAIQFSQDLEVKKDEIVTYSKRRDEFKAGIQSFQAQYEEKLKIQESSNGVEFLKIKKETDKMMIQINSSIEILEGQIILEINDQAEESKRMIKKFKYKEDKHKQCLTLRSQKVQEFDGWLIKLQSMIVRKERVEKALKTLSTNPEFRQIFLGFIARFAKIDQATSDIEYQVKENSKILASEGSELDQLMIRLIRVTRLDDIYDIIMKMKLITDSFNDDIDDLDKLLAQLEKEIMDFLAKLHGSAYTDCEKAIKKLENSLEKLNRKLKEVHGEKAEFQAELDGSSDLVDNKDQIEKALNGLGSELSNNTDQRDSIARQLDILRGRFSKLDKMSLDLKECLSITSESNTIEVKTNEEFDKAVDVQERLRKLRAKYRSLSENADQRKELLKRAAALVKDNRDQLRQMKLIGDILDKCNDFEILYRAMLRCPDYNPLKAKVERKMNRILAIRAEVEQYQKHREDLDKQLAIYTDEYLNNLADLDDIQAVIKDNEKISITVSTYVKNLSEISKALDRRRIKTKDAQIRTHGDKHLKTSEGIQKSYNTQMKELEELSIIVKSIVEDKKQQIQEKKDAAKKAYEEQQIILSEFKVRFDILHKQVVDFNVEIKGKDLETKEPIPGLAAYIDRLKKLGEDLDALKKELQKIAQNLSNVMGQLNSQDTSKKLFDLKNQLINAMKANNDDIDNIKRMINLTDAYDGYESGGDDTKFFKGMNKDSYKLMDDLKAQNEQFDKLLQEIDVVIDSAKKQASSAYDNVAVEELNMKIVKVEMRTIGNLSKKIKIDRSAVSNKEKMASHGLEIKVARRTQETEEIEKTNEEFEQMLIVARQQIEEEIEKCADDDMYKNYIEQLRSQLPEIEKLGVEAKEMLKLNKNLQVDCGQLNSEVKQLTQDTDKQAVNTKLDYFDQHLVIKKRIMDIKKEFQTKVWTVSKKVNDKVQDILSKKPVKVVKPMFKAVDELDKMLFDVLAKLGIPVNMSRIGGGYYMFGSKKIFCKIINGKLVVRVGGGYMGIEEFIMVYGKQEVDKSKAAADLEAKLREQIAASGAGDGGYTTSNMTKSSSKSILKDGTPKTGTASGSMGAAIAKSTFSSAIKK